MQKSKRPSCCPTKFDKVQISVLKHNVTRLARGKTLMNNHGSTSYLGMGQVQNGSLYISYRSSPKTSAIALRRSNGYL